MFEWHGYGRAYPPGRRQIAGAVFHLADCEPYRRLNDVVCACAGEIRAPSDPDQHEPDLVVGADQGCLPGYLLGARAWHLRNDPPSVA